MTPEDTAPVAQAAVLQGELAVREGLRQPDPVLAVSALPTTKSKFSSHGVSCQFQPLVALLYHLLLI